MKFDYPRNKYRILMSEFKHKFVFYPQKKEFGKWWTIHHMYCRQYVPIEYVINKKSLFPFYSAPAQQSLAMKACAKDCQRDYEENMPVKTEVVGQRMGRKLVAKHD